MDTKNFKKVFNDIALDNGFQNNFGAWFKESDETVIALILRKSNFSRLYYLRIKVNLKHAYGQRFNKDKEWVKHDVADLMLGIGKEYDDLFDLEKEIKEEERVERLGELFSNVINQMTDKALTRNGIIELYKRNDLFLLPAVKKELGLN
jgi:hypothetical protein